MRPIGSIAFASRPEAKAGEGGHDRPLERREVGAVAAAGRQRHVQVRVGGGARARHLEEARIDRVVAVLMHGDRQHRRVLEEGEFRAVAVVHVPVDDRDPVQAMHALGVVDAEHGVSKHAVAAAAIGLGVVTRRAHERVGVRDAAA
jgi:hypothetical protein